MTKNDVKFGMIAEMRDGRKFIVEREYQYLNNYDENLNYIDKDPALDIIKVYSLKNDACLECIWERKDVPQLTEQERRYLEAYSHDFTYIARNRNQSLYVYEGMPYKNIRGYWRHSCADTSVCLPILKFIKWEDMQPYSIKDLLSGSDGNIGEDEILGASKEQNQLVTQVIMTEREYAYLTAYSYDYNYIVRGNSGGLWVYASEPIQKYGYWYNGGEKRSFSSDSENLLKFIKSKDTKPYKISDLLRLMNTAI